MIDQPPKVFVEEWQECRPLSVRSDGVLVVTLSGSEREMEIADIELPKLPSAAFLEFLGRLSRLSKPLRCRVVGHTSTGRVRAKILYFGWQDKSGVVYLDLAQTLIKQGLARPLESNSTP